MDKRATVHLSTYKLNNKSEGVDGESVTFRVNRLWLAEYIAPVTVDEFLDTYTYDEALEVMRDYREATGKVYYVDHMRPYKKLVRRAAKFFNNSRESFDTVVDMALDHSFSEESGMDILARAKVSEEDFIQDLRNAVQ
jgi:hypothetical protein